MAARGPVRTQILFFIFILALFMPADAYALFDLSVTPRRGGQDIRFEMSGPGGLLRNEEATVTVTTDRARQYLITQTVYQPLTNEFGDTIPQGAFFVFSPSNPLGTLRIESEIPVTMGQFPIFTSNAAGDSDNFVLVFNVRVPENQPGGVYHARMTFTAAPVEPSAGMSPSTVNLDVRVEIRPNFSIVVQSRQGGQGLDFGRLTKDRLTAAETLNVTIESNIGRPYRILQQLREPLTSQEGEILEEAAVRFTASGGENGTLAARSGAANITESPTVLYTSDASGGSDAFQMQYTVAPEPTQKAGIYSGTLALRVESDSPLAPSQIFNIPLRIEVEPIFYLEAVMDQPSNIHFGTFRSGDENQARKVLITVHSNLGAPYQVTQILSKKLTNEEGATLSNDHFVYSGAEAQTGTLSTMTPASVQEGEHVVFTSETKGTPEKFVLNYSLTIPKGSKAGSYRSELRYSVTTL